MQPELNALSSYYKIAFFIFVTIKVNPYPDQVRKYQLQDWLVMESCIGSNEGTFSSTRYFLLLKMEHIPFVQLEYDNFVLSNQPIDNLVFPKLDFSCLS